MKTCSFSLVGLIFFTAFTFLPCHAEQAGEVAQTIERRYPNLASGVLTFAKISALPQGVLLKSEDIEIRSSDIEKSISGQPERFRPELRKNAFFVLEQEATGKLLKKVAVQELSENGKDVNSMDDNQLLKAFFDEMTKDVKVTDMDVETFYKENESVFCGTPLESVRKQIGVYVLQDKKQRIVDRQIQTLGKKMEIFVSDSWTKRQAANAKDNPLDKARATGKPTLAIFSAASCCGPDKMIPVKNALQEKFDDKISIVYVEPTKEQILAARYGIHSIPTQVLYDSSGKEFFRHSGFYSEKDISNKLREMRVE
ncbi:MAG TPA: hypothetical protein HPP51_04755 [Planctomycetes bacterium]|nr:hypothetical protein [Planctomycetota bacterium]